MLPDPDILEAARSARSLIATVHGHFDRIVTNSFAPVEEPGPTASAEPGARMRGRAVDVIPACPAVELLERQGADGPHLGN